MIQVSWQQAICGWIKVNTDGATRGSPGGYASCGGILRDKSTATLGCFSKYLGISYAFHADLVAAMMAIEMTFQRGWNIGFG